MKVIAHIRTDFPEKFGIPRQSSLVRELTGKIVFEPEYRSPDAVKGLEGFNYIWLLWQFQVPATEHFVATVTPPRLGGKKHMGVFATRSPFRPNNIGLSSVHLDKIELTENGPVLYVSGVDLRDNTPIYDIKPYLPYSDCHPDAKEGFVADTKEYALEVEFPSELLEQYPPEKRSAIIQVLKQDPRPSYHSDPNRKYGVSFAGWDVHFTVIENKLTVFEMVKL